MGNKGLWSLKFSTATIVLIPAAVGINYLGKLFAGVLKLPLWLDSIGTVLASILAGPIVGAIAGATNNIIYGLTFDIFSFAYALTSVVIGISVGILAHKGWFDSWGKAFVSGIVVALVAAVVSTPINVILWGGQTGNMWGDALYAYLIAQDMPIWIASFLDELVVDVPDKIATILVSYAIFKGLPKSIVTLFNNDDEIERI